MTDSQIDQLIAAVRALPAAERVRVAQRVVDGLPAEDRLQVVQAVIRAPSSLGAQSMLGLFADEPDLVDHVCRHAYMRRAANTSDE